ERRPEALPVLARPFHVDRRGGVRPGEEATVRFPVLATDGGEVLCRYLRYWIEVGQEKAGAPLSTEQSAALDALDKGAADPALGGESLVRRGEILFLNNRWLRHTRPGFEDHAEPGRRRHLVRLWLHRA